MTTCSRLYLWMKFKHHRSVARNNFDLYIFRAILLNSFNDIFYSSPFLNIYSLKSIFFLRFSSYLIHNLASSLEILKECANFLASYGFLRYVYKINCLILFLLDFSFKSSSWRLYIGMSSFVFYLFSISFFLVKASSIKSVLRLQYKDLSPIPMSNEL